MPYAVHEPANSPVHVRHREVNQKHPACDEYQHRSVFHALSDGSNNQSGGDYGERQLKHRVNVLRYPVSVIGVLRRSDAVREEELGTAIEWVIENLADDQAVPEGPPENGDEPADDHALSHNRKRVR